MLMLMRFSVAAGEAAKGHIEMAKPLPPCYDWATSLGIVFLPCGEPGAEDTVRRHTYGEGSEGE